MPSENLTIWLIALALSGCAFWPAVRLFQAGEEIKALLVGAGAILLFFAALMLGGMVV